MKTKKLLRVMNFVEAYRELMGEAYKNYENYLEYWYRNAPEEEEKKMELAINALVYAIRANTVYDSAFYAEIQGLPSNLSDIEKRESKYHNDFTMDDIVRNIKSELKITARTIEDLNATLEIKGDKELCDVIKGVSKDSELCDEEDVKL